MLVVLFFIAVAGALPHAVAATNIVSCPAGFTRLSIGPDSEILASLPFHPFNPSIQEIFTGQLTGLTNAVLADHVITWDAQQQQYRSAFKVDGSGNPGQDGLWFENEGSWTTSSITLYPGTAFWIDNRQFVTQTVWLCGSVVLEDEESVTFQASLNLFGYPFSSKIALNDTALREDGAFGATAMTNADRITETPANQIFWLLDDPASSNHGLWLDENSLVAQEELLMGQGYWYFRSPTNYFTWTESRPYSNPFPTNQEPPVISAIHFDSASNEVSLYILTTGLVGTLEIFTLDLAYTGSLDTTTGWLVAATNLGVDGTTQIIWTASTAFSNGAYGTRLFLAARGDIDSDGDGLSDAREQFIHHTSPTQSDSDQDDLSDAAEIVLGTNPLIADTDEDGYTDGYETASGSDPLSTESIPMFTISGTAAYSGSQTGVFRVSARRLNTVREYRYTATIGGPGPYAISNVPALWSYEVAAYCDSDSNEVQGTCEAEGVSPASPLYLTGSVSGVDIVVSDDGEPVLLGIPSEQYTECDSVPPAAPVLAMDDSPLLTVTNGLVLYLPFDSEEDDLITDYSGWQNDGTATGTVFTQDGVVGGACEFDGVDDYILFGATASLNVSNRMTLAAWFYANDTDQQPIIEWANGGAHMWTQVIGYQWQGRGTGANLCQPGTDHVISIDNPPIQQWHHLAVTYDGLTGVGQVYLDGTLAKEEYMGLFMPGTEGELYVGARTGSVYFNGRLDEVRIYNRPLSAQEVSNLCSAAFLLPVNFNESSDGACDETITRVWSATDECGHTVAATQIVHVADTTPPVFSEAPTHLYLDNPNDLPATPVSRSWGLYANNGGVSKACRDFSEPLAPGETLSLDMDNGFIQGPPNSGKVGFVLQDAAGGTNLFELFFAGGDQFYTIVDAAGDRNSGIEYTVQGVHIDLTLTDSSNYIVRIERLEGASQWGPAVAEMTGVLANAGDASVNRLILYNNNAGYDAPYDLFFNNLAIDSRAHDNASATVYDDLWYSGDNGGIGFESWVVWGFGGPQGDPYNYGRFTATSTQNDYVGDTNGDNDIDSWILLVTDSCDRHIPVRFSAEDNSGTGCAGDPLIINNVWSAEDDCGNTSRYVQVIMLEDATPPVLSETPQDITVSCDEVQPPPEILASDNAGDGSISSNDLSLYYPLNDDEGGNVSDESGQELDGTAHGYTLVQDGIVGGAYRLNGVDGCIDIPDSELLRTSKLGFSLWFKPDVSTPGTAVSLLSKRAVNGAGGYALEWQAGNLTFMTARHHVEEFLSASCPWVSGQWYHVVGTYDGARKSLYLNDTLVAETNESISLHYTALSPRLGASAGPNPSNYFCGVIDEVRIFRRSLSASEIHVLYQRTGSIVPVQYSETATGLCNTVYIRTWQAEDACGNSVTWTQRITAVDCDTDGDGLTDCWELQYGLDPLDAGGLNSIQGAEGDPDNDGFSNLEEFEAQTDPFESDISGYRVWYVSSEAPGSGDGSFTNPFPVILNGVNSATNGDVVLLKRGYYTGWGNYNVSFQGKSITVKGVAGAALTVVDAQSYRGFVFNSGETSNSVLEGLCVRYGQDGGLNGAGLYLAQASPTIRGCVLELCTASRFGGGLYASGSSARVLSCVIRGNAAEKGAGIYMIDSDLTIMSCAIEANTATNGGAIYCAGSSSPDIFNNTIMANDTGADGVIVADDSSSPQVVNNIVSFNSSGIRKSAGASLVTRNNCVYENSTANYQGLNDPTGTNGNISVDPQLTSVLYGNVFIEPDSPCVDAGDDTVVLSGSTDLKSRSRTVGLKTDIGAIELQSTLPGLDQARATIIRVDSENGHDDHDGSSWDSAKQTIRAAITNSPNMGDEGIEVWVRQGLYYESLVIDKPHVALYGGFQGNETYRWRRSTDPSVTVMDGHTSNRVIALSGKGTLPTVIDGFTIQNGMVMANRGAGVYCGGNATIQNCVIRHNRALHYYISGGFGGGVSCYGGRPVFRDCTLVGNVADDGGSAIDCLYSSSQFINCSIVNNTGVYGAAAVNLIDSATVLQNCTIANNSSPYTWTGPTNRGVNLSAGYSGATNKVTVNNCILWSNDYGEIGGTTNLILASSIVEGGYSEGGASSDIVTNNPLFVDMPAGDIHIQHGSFGIDHGPSDALTLGLDWESHYGTDPDGIHGDAGLIDIGYHYPSYSQTSDTDEDGLPDWWEELYFGDATTGNPIADTDDDGFLNIDEFRAGSDPSDEDDYPSNTVYVDCNVATSGSGTFSDPLQTIQEGINALSTGGTVMVKDGIYQRSGDKNLTFGTVAVTVKSQHGATNTIIDCGHSGRGATLKAGCTLDGLTIRNGFLYSQQNGAGLYFPLGGTARNCIIISNSIAYPSQQGYGAPSASGGGVFIYSSGTLHNCAIGHNATYGWYGYYGGYVASYGGGIHVINNALVEHCTIFNNSSDYGSGICGPATVKDSIVWDSTVQSLSSVSCSCIQNWTGGGTGNITNNPQLTDVSANDVHLPLTSPAIDSGSVPAETLGLDWIRGFGTNPDGVHGDGGKVDMGYHYFGYSADAVLQDTDSDGLPDFWELLYFESATGADPGDDDDEDGFTNLEEYNGGSHPLDANSIPPLPRLTCNGKDIVTESGDKIILKGVNIGSWMGYEQWMLKFEPESTSASDLGAVLAKLNERFPDEGETIFRTFVTNYFRGEDLDYLKSLGYNCIRVPFGSRFLEDEGESGVTKPEGYALLDWVVTNCYRRHMYVLLDMHAVPGGQSPWDHNQQVVAAPNRLWSNPDLQDQTVALWQKIASRYAGNPAVAGYDLFNEPDPDPYVERVNRNHCYTNNILPMLRRLYDGIRAEDQDHLIFMMSNIGFTNMWFALDWLPSPAVEGWDNIVYEFHYYENIGVWQDYQDPSFNRQKYLADELVRQVVRFSDQMNVPVYIGEFMPSWDENFDYFMRQFNANGIHWAHWNFRDYGNGLSEPGLPWSSWGLDYKRDGWDSSQIPNLTSDSRSELERKFSLYTHSNYSTNPVLPTLVSNHTHQVGLSGQRMEAYLNTFGAPNSSSRTADSAWPWLMTEAWPTNNENAYCISNNCGQLHPAPNSTIQVTLKSRPETYARFEVADTSGCRFSVDIVTNVIASETTGDDTAVQLCVLRDSITNAVYHYDTEGLIARMLYDKATAQVVLKLYAKDGGADLWGEELFTSDSIPFTPGTNLELLVDSTNATLRYAGTARWSGPHYLSLDRWPNGAVCVVEVQDLSGNASYMDIDNLTAARPNAAFTTNFVDTMNQNPTNINVVAVPEYWSVENNSQVNEKTEAGAIRWTPRWWNYGGMWANPRCNYQNPLRIDVSGSHVAEIRSTLKDYNGGILKMGFAREFLPAEIWGNYNGPAFYLDIEYNGGSLIFNIWRHSGTDGGDHTWLAYASRTFDSNKAVSFQVSATQCSAYYGTEQVISPINHNGNINQFVQGLCAHMEFQNSSSTTYKKLLIDDLVCRQLNGFSAP